MRAPWQTHGVRLLVLAFLLAVIGGIVSFPVWSSGPSGTGMHILLGDVPAGPVTFVWERLGFAAAVLGLVGACLIEVGREAPQGEPRRRWYRERTTLLVVVLAEATFLGTLGLLTDLSFDPLPFLAAGSVVVAVALGLYFFWTAERLAGVGPRILPVVALVVACVSAALQYFVELAFGAPVLEWWNTLQWIDVSRWLLGEVSLALWAFVFSGLLLRRPMVYPASPAVGS